MLMIGLALIYGGYSLGFWGYCQVKGYSLTLGQIMSPKAYSGSWPPTVGSPTSASSTGGSSGSGSGGGTTSTITTGTGGTGVGGSSNAGTGASGPFLNK